MNRERITELQTELSQIHQRGREIQAELKVLWEADRQSTLPKPVSESQVVGYLSNRARIDRALEPK